MGNMHTHQYAHTHAHTATKPVTHNHLDMLASAPKQGTCLTRAMHAPLARTHLCTHAICMHDLLHTHTLTHSLTHSLTHA
jgi:hypothetical protein